MNEHHFDVLTESSLLLNGVKALIFKVTDSNMAFHAQVDISMHRTSREPVGQMCYFNCIPVPVGISEHRSTSKFLEVQHRMGSSGFVE